MNQFYDENNLPSKQDFLKENHDHMTWNTRNINMYNDGVSQREKSRFGF